MEFHLDKLRGGFAPVAKEIKRTGRTQRLVSRSGRVLTRIELIGEGEVPPDAFEITHECMTLRRSHIAHYAAGGLKFVMRKGGDLYLIYPPKKRDPLLPKLDELLQRRGQPQVGVVPSPSTVPTPGPSDHSSLDELRAQFDALTSRVDEMEAHLARVIAVRKPKTQTAKKQRKKDPAPPNGRIEDPRQLEIPSEATSSNSVNQNDSTDPTTASGKDD